MKKRQTLPIAAAVLMMGLAVAALATGAVATDETQSNGDIQIATTDTKQEVADTITTGQAEITSQYGLQPLWDQAYGGRSQAGRYDFDGDGENEQQQCANCHMEAKGGTKHNPPLHPIGLSQTDTGNWFLDNGQHLGPVVNLATQYSGIKPDVQCGDCHTPSNANQFGSPEAGATNNPHSVHVDVITREGCIRCHTRTPRTFEGEAQFTQGGADRNTFGVANPINMTRVWDGKFLSTETEAAYNADGDSSGSGWNKYASSESDRTNKQSCGDCHDQYHAQGGLSFAFDASSDSRKGPFAQVNDANSIGIKSGQMTQTCGDCHVTDAHAVHTNGKLNRLLNWQKATDHTDTSMIDSGARGAELCDQCHSQRLTQFGGGGNHGSPQAARRLGLRGPRNAPPDAFGMGVTNGDCGFCHK